jgi:hypothetical protein
VGVREFRESLARYLDSAAPIAITRRGRTVDYYVPTRGRLNEEEWLALRRAVEELEAIIAEHGLSEHEILREFRARRSRS